MKKLFFSLLFVMAGMAVLAQNTYKEAVHLKNGSVIKGVILEQVPNESLKIQTGDGSVFVYSMDEVQKIEKEVVETSSPSPVGIMERDGKNLTLDGRELSDQEVLTLVGQANYETYLGAQKQITTGRVFTGVFIGAASATLFCLVAGMASEDLVVVYSAYLPALLADVSCPLMCIFNGIGKGRMNWVADEYNRNAHPLMSYSLSPSIMRLNAPLAEGNTALGLTLSINF